MSESILVTGGAGYIGSHACKALDAAGFSPIVFDNLSSGNRWAVQWGAFELGDIGDAVRLSEVFSLHRPIAVLHFAASALVGESMQHPSRYYRNNFVGAMNVIDCARLFGCRAFVLSSTCAVYGSVDGRPISESMPKGPINPYGRSKLMVENLLADFDAAYGFPFLALRYFNAAGADPSGIIGERRDVETHLIPLALDAAARRRPPLSIWGNDYATPDGTAIRDYVHVCDLADAHVHGLKYLLDGGSSRSVNLGTGQGVSVRTIIEMINRVTGKDVPHIEGPRRPGDPAELVADPTEGRRLLGDGLTRRSDLETILRDAWAWHSSDRYSRQFFLAK